MALLAELGSGQGYAKVGFLGFQGSGKTRTALDLACGLRQYFALDGPIAMFDTEGGSEYIASRVHQLSGRPLMGIRSRSFSELLAVGEECLDKKVPVLVVDSVTHVWRELCEAYLKQVNERLRESGRKSGLRTRLEFQDWQHVKRQWTRWADFYLNAPMHIIICGRAGFEYDMAENEEGRKELVKTGIKMRVESEFGYEPSLLVEMERQQVPDEERPGHFRIRRRATVLKCRFGAIDGASCEDPTFTFFEPHIALLRPGVHAPVDTGIKTDAGVGEDGDSEWIRERRLRAILCEEIQGELVNRWPGQSAPEKKAKTEMIHEIFNTRSWTKVESLDSETLRRGLEAIREKLGQMALALSGDES